MPEFHRATGLFLTSDLECIVGIDPIEFDLLASPVAIIGEFEFVGVHGATPRVQYNGGIIARMRCAIFQNCLKVRQVSIYQGQTKG